MYEELVEALRTARTMYGLEEWTFCVEEATGDDVKRMEATDEIVLCQADAGYATFTYHPRLMEQWLAKTEKTDPLLGVAVHEWGHIVLNPWGTSGVFDVSGEREETHACHLEYAFRYVPTSEDPIDAAYHICHLDENRWVVHRHVGRTEFEGERLPGFAWSLWAEEAGASMGWGALAARQIEFWLDPEYIEELGLSLKDVVLREMWRVVLNPDGRPHRNNVTEHKLDCIMRLMHAAGK